MECMRTVFLHKKAVIISIIEHIASNMFTSLPNLYGMALLHEFSSNDCTTKAAANNKIIHIRTHHIYS